MRSALLFHLVSGHAWFTGGGVIVLLLLLDLTGTLRTRPRVQSLARILFLLAAGLAMLSGTPVRVWLLIPLVLAIVAVMATGFRGDATRASRLASIATAALVIVALGLEARWHRTPTLEAPRSILILGDSLSSGGFGETSPWPERLALLTGVPVRSSALPGETTASALTYQMDGLQQIGAGTLILIELGGNDLLGGTPVTEFAANLDAILQGANRSGSAVAMFELPIPPGRWRWGGIQREAARKHGVPLIPKRVLARLVSSRELVGDGLHPTDAGHAFLAREVVRLFP